MEWVKKKLPRKESREVPALRGIQQNLSADQVVDTVSKFCGVEPEEVLNRKTKSKHLRQMTMELCYRHSNLRQKQIGKMFGVDYSTVSVNRSRLKNKLKSDSRLNKLFKQIQEQIINLST